MGLPDIHVFVDGNEWVVTNWQMERSHMSPPRLVLDVSDPGAPPPPPFIMPFRTSEEIRKDFEFNFEGYTAGPFATDEQIRADLETIKEETA